jgi:hypothetical protein
MNAVERISAKFSIWPASWRGFWRADSMVATSRLVGWGIGTDVAAVRLRTSKMCRQIWLQQEFELQAVNR